MKHKHFTSRVNEINNKVKRKLRDDENSIKEKILNLFEKKLIFEAIDNFDQKKLTEKQQSTLKLVNL